MLWETENSLPWLGNEHVIQLIASQWIPGHGGEMLPYFIKVYTIVQTWLNVSGLLSSNSRPRTKILDLESPDSCSEFVAEPKEPSVGLPETFLVWGFSDSIGIFTLYADQSMFGSWNTKTWHTIKLGDNHLNWEQKWWKIGKKLKYFIVKGNKLWYS
jgi:hypothetical protein